MPADPRFHLAQLNIGRLVAPTDHPSVAPFMDALDEVNALADASPGFVWRLQTESGNATDVRPYDDDQRMLVNLSVWTDLESLSDYVYRSDHTAFLRRRREWFERPDGPIMVLWWVPADHIPTIEEAQARLEHLRDHGPTPEAFTFRLPFPPPSAGGASGLSP